MITKETNGGHSEESSETDRRVASRVQEKSNAIAKSAGKVFEPGSLSFDRNDIDSMLRQQEKLAAAIASSRRREEFKKRIQCLETQRDNAEETEEPLVEADEQHDARVVPRPRARRYMRLADHGKACASLRKASASAVCRKSTRNA